MAEEQTMTPTNKKWLSSKEAAAHAQVGLQSIYIGVKRKRLRAARVNNGREFRFLVEWVDAWLEADATPIDLV